MTNGIMWNYYIEGIYEKMPQKGTHNLIFAFVTKNGEIAGKPTEVEMKNVVAFCEIGKPEEWDGWKTREEEEKDENG